MRTRWQGWHSAYVQLVLLVFVPMAILALVGMAVVFHQSRMALISAQDAQAQTVLWLLAQNNIAQENAPQALALARLRGGVAVWQSGVNIQGYIDKIDGINKIDSINMQGDNVQGDMIGKIHTPQGTLYAKRIDKKNGNHSTDDSMALVLMDDAPLRVAQYRTLLVLIGTACLTLLVLLFILHIYASRQIAPIYEMRLFLQKLSLNRLDIAPKTRAQGELGLLAKDLGRTLGKLAQEFAEMKATTLENERDLLAAFDKMEMQNIDIRAERDHHARAHHAKTAFLANMSHELRTPLNSIDGFIHLLAKEPLTPKQAMYAKTIRQSGAHLLALINDVLDFSKIEAGKLSLQIQSFDFYAQVYEVANMLAPLAQQKGLRMAVLYYDDVAHTIDGDALRIKQILTNLLANAIKYTEQGQIVVRVSQGEMACDGYDGSVMISVQDTGRGVADDSIFASFAQADPSDAQKGAGLGLAICQRLVRLMDGQIGYFNHEGAGATFWFELPQNLRTPTKPTTPSLGRALYWLDNTAAMHALGAALEKCATATSASSLPDLLQKLANPFDVVFCDGTGESAALLREIRARHVGALYVYGYVGALDGELLARFGAKALDEPLNPHALFDDSLGKAATRVQGFKGKSVLIVDDHLPNLLVLDALLGEYQVQTISAQSGMEALELVSRLGVDLVFLDLHLPKMSGAETAQAMRKLGINAPIIALSAHIPDDTRALKASGFDECLQKPMGQGVLLDILTRFLKQKPSAEAPKIAMPIFDNAQALARAGQKSELAQKLARLAIMDAKDKANDLDAAWQARDRDGLASLAHTIHGGASYTGFVALETSARAFYELCAKNPEHTAKSQFSLLKPSYDALMQALDGVANYSLDTDL